MIELSGKNRTLKNEDFSEFLDTDRYDKELFQEADHIRQEYYGTDVYIRGLIEFTNYYRTFVLQGGEDPYFKDKDICEMVYEIKSKHSDRLSGWIWIYGGLSLSDLFTYHIVTDIGNVRKKKK